MQIVLDKQKALLAYWERLRPEGRLPRKSDFDPIDIPPLLGDLLWVAVERQPMRFRIHLYGSNVEELRGENLTGAYVDEVTGEHIHERVLDSYRWVASEGKPFFDLIPHDVRHARVVDYHRLMLPFAEDGGTVDFILISFIAAPVEHGHLKHEVVRAFWKE